MTVVIRLSVVLRVSSFGTWTHIDSKWSTSMKRPSTVRMPWNKSSFWMSSSTTSSRVLVNSASVQIHSWATTMVHLISMLQGSCDITTEATANSRSKNRKKTVTGGETLTYDLDFESNELWSWCIHTQSTSSRVRWFKSKSGNRQMDRWMPMDRWMKEQKDGWTRVIALP